MKPGFCYISEATTAPAAFSSVRDSLELAGITLRHPATSVIAYLDDDGSDIPTSEDILSELVGAREALTVLFWISPNADVSPNLRVLGDKVRHSYSVDGLNPPEVRKLADWAIGYFRGAMRRATAQILVIDTKGRTEDVPWDDVTRNRLEVSPILPDVLVIPRDRRLPVAFDRPATIKRTDGFFVITDREHEEAFANLTSHPPVA